MMQMQKLSLSLNYRCRKETDMAKKLISPAERVTEHYKRLEFSLIEDPSGGFSFNCDDNGNVVFNEEYRKAQEENYNYAVNHPELYSGPFIREYSNTYTKNAIALCECGEEIELYDEYMGACECPNCGTWHNLFGQTLNNPSEWEQDY